MITLDISLTFKVVKYIYFFFFFSLFHSSPWTGELNAYTNPDWTQAKEVWGRKHISVEMLEKGHGLI